MEKYLLIAMMDVKGNIIEWKMNMQFLNQVMKQIVNQTWTIRYDNSI